MPARYAPKIALGIALALLALEVLLRTDLVVLALYPTNDFVAAKAILSALRK